jgi:hypothetical protein
MKVMTENFSRLINAKLGDAKPLVNEQSVFPAFDLLTGEPRKPPVPKPPVPKPPVPKPPVPKPPVPKPPLSPEETKFNGKTVNLYYDSNNKDFLSTEQIKYIKKNSSEIIHLFLARGGELTFSCLDKTLKYNFNSNHEYTNDIEVYNTPLTNELIKTVCTTSSGGTSGPKADFAVNSSNTNANFT